MALVSSYDRFIFDYGGVLAHHQQEADQARLSEIAQIPRGLLNELYWSERPDYDKDLVSGQEYWNRVAHRAGTTLSERSVEELIELDTRSWMQFDSVMWEWVDQLRLAGKRLALLSNMPRDLGEALKSGTQKLSSFDYLTLSYEVRAVKPEPVVYQLCLEGLDATPEQTLFLDDRIENVQGAELLGIRAIQFTNRDDVLLLLRN
ncbi:MAG: HAD family phosphatase [Acidobacteriaceae bacterium]|nr:HAD family phosphatase [Acidobacteriaceae bacterium]MBV9780566.1 HAD family phosphatase [Acidobacteriaceae bacterium]